MKRLFKPPSDDIRKKARYELEGTISDMNILENELKADIRSIAGEVKRMNSMSNRMSIQNLLITSKNKRHRLVGVTKQRMALERQYDALISMELNEQVIASYKHTSSALKSLGLETQINDIEDTMMELQEGAQDVMTINSTLGQGISSVHDTSALALDEDELESELNILLGDDNDPANITPSLLTPLPRKVSKPSISNTMSKDEDVKSNSSETLQEQVEIRKESEFAV